MIYSFSKSKVNRRIHSTKIIVVLLISTLLLGSVSFSATTGPAAAVVTEATTENAGALYLKSIDESLSAYERDTAYKLILEAYDKVDFNTDPANYLSILNHLVMAEKYYLLLDQMVIHAIELYNLSSVKQYAYYRMIALDALAYYDYNFFDNAKMLKKLEELLLLPVDETLYPKLSYYYEGIAFLAMDNKEYKDAFDYLNKALTHEKRTPAIPGYNYQASTLYNLAVLFVWQEDYYNAIKYLEMSIKTTDSKDYDTLYDYHILLSDYYYNVGLLDEAKENIDFSEGLFDKVSTLYKENFKDDALKKLKANIAYSKEDYKTAATYYNELLHPEVDHDYIQQNITAQTAAADFEQSSIKEQINLLESFKKEQTKRFEIQNHALWLSSIMIGLLIFVVVLVILAFVWQLKQRSRLYKLSITDQLTQTFNRTYILDCLDKIDRPTQCIAILDLDRFKEVNDTYGHLVGDEVLRRVSNTISSSIRPQDTIGRYGGEEFLLIIDTDNVEIANSVAERVRENIESLEWSFPNLQITTSIGLAMSSRIKSDNLLSEADILLYKAKDLGRNKVMFQQFS